MIFWLEPYPVAACRLALSVVSPSFLLCSQNTTDDGSEYGRKEGRKEGRKDSEKKAKRERDIPKSEERTNLWRQREKD